MQSFNDAGAAENYSPQRNSVVSKLFSWLIAMELDRAIIEIFHSPP